jgi:hypothetical protein
MNKWLTLLLIPLLGSCMDESSEEPKEAFFPVRSYLQSQVAHIDSSIYRIIKITTVGGKKDTSFVRREEFKAYAKDFLDIPDIAHKKWRDDYKESEIYDEEMQTAVLNYMPVDEDGEIRRQDVFITPDRTGDKVKTIYIERQLEEANKPVRKLLTWEVDRRFRIVSIKAQGTKEEKIETLEVLWTEGPTAE